MERRKTLAEKRGSRCKWRISFVATLFPGSQAPAYLQSHAHSGTAQTTEARERQERESRARED